MTKEEIKKEIEEADNFILNCDIDADEATLDKDAHYKAMLPKLYGKLEGYDLAVQEIREWIDAHDSSIQFTTKRLLEYFDQRFINGGS